MLLCGDVLLSQKRCKKETWLKGSLRGPAGWRFLAAEITGRKNK